MALGIRLSDIGLGDYWEDVDAVTRNLLMEQQFVDAAKLRAVAAASPPRCEAKPLPGQETGENMPERIVGIFAPQASPNSLPADNGMGCCTANGTQGLYYAWEGALRCEGDVAQVNLLVNRASRLADVDSYLPYEGKVVIHNKGARRIAVRILSWIDRHQLRVCVSGQPRPLSWVGSHLVLDDLQPGEEISLEFPVPETTVSYTALHKIWKAEQVYTYTFRGSTVVDVTPKDTRPTSIPIYERSHLRRDKAPMKKVLRFAPDKPLVDW